MPDISPSCPSFTQQRPFAFGAYPRGYWDDQLIPNRESIFILIDGGDNMWGMKIAPFPVDEHVKTYGDLDAVVALEVLAGNFGAAAPVLLRPQANLSKRNLWAYCLDNVDLRGADLSDANLTSTGFRRADLRGADLSGAIVGSSTLYGADLRDANVSNTYLTSSVINESTDFTGAYCDNIRGLPKGWVVDPNTCRLVRQK
jgi:hypothetical protein